MNIQFVFRLFKTSVGRKLLMAATGLMLAAFMLIHLAENLLLFYGEPAYNGWVDFLLANPLTPLLEFGLLGVFLVHIVMGSWVRWEDWINSRGRNYEEINLQGGRTIGSVTMLYTAIALLAYLTYHMLTFRFADHSVGFYQMVTDAFRGKVFVAVYVAGALALALHLSHGFQSAFQTLGVNHEKYTPLIKLAGWAIAILMVGFALISMYYLLGADLKITAEPKVLETVIN